MPKGPQGQRRPADVIGCAVAVARIATGEDEDTPITPKGVAGGKARAKALSPSERSKIASIAAESRWQKRRMTMQTAHKTSDAASGRDAVRMYPSNKLKEQVRAFGSNLSVVQVMKGAFDQKA